MAFAILEMPATPAIPARMAVVMLVLFISTLLDRPQGFVLCAAAAQIAVHTALTRQGSATALACYDKALTKATPFQTSATGAFCRRGKYKKILSNRMLGRVFHTCRLTLRGR